MEDRNAFRTKRRIGISPVIRSALVLFLFLDLIRTGAVFGQSFKASLASATLTKTSLRQWPRDLGLHEADLHPLSLNPLGCPVIEASISGRPLSLMFDTGTAQGFMITNSAPPVSYRLLGRGGELNADGSPRGESSRILVERLSVLGEEFTNAEGSLADWKMFSSHPFSGTVGLEFFLTRRVTLDYRAGKVGVTASPLPEKLDARRYIGLDLVAPPRSQGHVLYVRARVNHRNAIIYLDTGTNVSFIDPQFSQDLERVERPGRFKVFRQSVPLVLGGQSFLLNDLREAPISRGPGFDLPVALTIGSDLLSQFIMTIDLRAGRIVLALGD